MMQKAIIFLLGCLLTACTVTPKPITINERYEQAKKDVNLLFCAQKLPQKQITFPEALARGLKYNLDYRIKISNAALEAGQFDIALFTMFPALNASGSLYSRNNHYASFSILPNGQTTDVITSTPDTIRSLRMGLSWNILDFGLGYVRAQQQGNRILIAEEESRKQLQQLSQDILVAYWIAYSAQELMGEAREFQIILTNAKNRLSQAILDPTVPKESILNYQSALLDGNRQIMKLKYKYEKSMIDLKHLLNLPPDVTLVLSPPPLELRNMHDLSTLDFRKLDALTLTNRPELLGQEYQRRIAKLGIKTAILQALPGITINDAWNYNSNKFLLNNNWVDRSMDVAWNLLNLASLPAAYHTAKTQVTYEKLKLMALTLTVLTETRYAYSHYENLRMEYEVAHKQTENADAIYRLNRDRHLATLASNQQVVTAKLRKITAKMDEDLLLADLSTALGELYLSSGLDILSTHIGYRPLPEIIKILHNKFITQNTWDFKEYVNNVYAKQFGQFQIDAGRVYRSPSITNASRNDVNAKHSSIAIAKMPQKKQFTLQIFGNYQLAKVTAFKKKLPKTAALSAAKTKNNQQDWYILTYGNFADAASAETALKQLPPSFKKFSPWVRSTETLQWVT